MEIKVGRTIKRLKRGCEGNDESFAVRIELLRRKDSWEISLCDRPVNKIRLSL